MEEEQKKEKETNEAWIHGCEMSSKAMTRCILNIWNEKEKWKVGRANER